MTTSTPPTEPPRLSVGIAIDVGRSRKGKPNQDSLGVYSNYINDPALLRAKGLLFVVADGMGGAAGGKEASETAVQSIIQGYYDDPDLDPRACLERAIQSANTEIGQIGRANPDLRGLGTTLVVTLIRGQSVLVSNVGDSRVYLFRRGRLRQLSLDHTVVQEHLRAGLLTPEEAMVHPRRHVLSRNLGSRPEAQPDYIEEPLQIDDIVLLCSDGLWGPVSDYEIGQLLKQDTQAAAESLIERANAQGGPDNISAVVVRVDAWGEAAKPVRAPVTQPITQPLVDDPTSSRAAPATMVIDQPSEPTPPAPPSVPSIAARSAAAPTQRITTPPTRPVVSASVAPEAAHDLRDKLGEPPAATPPPRKHAVWMIPAIVGGIILALILAFVVVRPVSAPTTTVTSPTVQGTFAVAPTLTLPAPATGAPGTASTNGPVVAPAATVGATATARVQPTVARVPTVSSASTSPAATTLPVVEAAPDETAAPVATTRAATSGGALTGGQTSAPRAGMVFGTNSSVLTLDNNNQVVSWNSSGQSTPIELLNAGPDFTPGNVRGTLAGQYLNGSITRLRVTSRGVVSDLIEVDASSAPSAVTHTVFSFDGTKLVYVVDDSIIRLWNETTNTSTDLPTDNPNTVTSIVWTRDGQIFATARENGTIEVWDATGKSIKTFEQNANVTALAFDPINTFLLSLSDQGTVQVREIATGELSQLLAPAASWSSLAFDATGSLLSAGSEDGKLIIWSEPLSKDVTEVNIDQPAEFSIAGLAFTPDDQQVAVLETDGTVRFLPVSSQ